MESLLIVDDSDDIRKQLQWGLGKEYAVYLAGDSKEALSVFDKQKTKVVLLDMGLPPHEDGTEEGFRCLEQILKICPATKIIIITGQSDRENALKAIQTGAYDFYPKPIDLKELKVIINRAVYLYNIEEENNRLQSFAVKGSGELIGMIGMCPAMEKVFLTIKKIASSDAPIFVVGESGTGKELVARAVHSMSHRNKTGFIAINCGAIPENLLESELFGVEKGAFTGASVQIAGKVEYAHEGTLFLDEITEMPVNLQVKLLRFLQEKIIQRVGGRKDISVDARIISATNADIAKTISEGRFREDLYYRLGVITINLPPLRERGDDILLLANLFLKRFSEKAARKVKGFANDALEFMMSYQWPGNVRELENRVQRAVIMSEAALIRLHDLGFAEGVKDESKATMALTLKEARDKIERDMLISAIDKHQGNMTRISEALGVSRTTLYDLMKKHDIHNTA